MDGTRDGHDDERHARAAELLPWYVNGTLDDGERAAVAAHLERCAECREQLALWRRLAPEVAAAGEAPAPHPAQFRRLVERLNDEIEPSGARPRRRLFRLPRAWRWVLLGQSAAIALLAAALAVDGTPRRAPASFRTLAAPAAPATGGIFVRVVFDERASERELRELLVPLGAALAGGPSPLGVYTVRLPAGESAEEAAAALRARPIIRFAEPVTP